MLPTTPRPLLPTTPRSGRQGRFLLPRADPAAASPRELPAWPPSSPRQAPALPDEHLLHMLKMRLYSDAVAATRKRDLDPFSSASMSMVSPRFAPTAPPAWPRHRVVGLAAKLSSAAACEHLLRGRLEGVEFAAQLAAMPPATREEWSHAFGACVAKLAQTLVELQSQLRKLTGAETSFQVNFGSDMEKNSTRQARLARSTRNVIDRAEAMEVAFEEVGETARAELSRLPADALALVGDLFEREGRRRTSLAHRWRRAIKGAIAITQMHARALDTALVDLARASLRRAVERPPRRYARAGVRRGEGKGGEGKGLFARHSLSDGDGDGDGDGDDDGDGDGAGADGEGADGEGAVAAAARAVCQHARCLLGGAGEASMEATLYLLVKGSHARAPGSGLARRGTAGALDTTLDEGAMLLVRLANDDVNYDEASAAAGILSKVEAGPNKAGPNKAGILSKVEAAKATYFDERRLTDAVEDDVPSDAVGIESAAAEAGPNKAGPTQAGPNKAGPPSEDVRLVYGVRAVAVPMTSLAGECMRRSRRSDLARDLAGLPMGSALQVRRGARYDANYNAAADGIGARRAPPAAALYLDLSDESGALRAVLRLAVLDRAEEGDESSSVAVDEAARAAAATSLLSPASQRLLSSLRPLFTLTLREPVRAAAAAFTLTFTREGALAHTLTALSMGLARLPKGAVAVRTLMGALGAMCCDALGAATCTLFLFRDMASGRKLVGYPVSRRHGAAEPLSLNLPPSRTPGTARSRGLRGVEGGWFGGESGGADVEEQQEENEDEDEDEEEDDDHGGGAADTSLDSLAGRCAAQPPTFLLLNGIAPDDPRLHPAVDAVPAGARGPLSLVCAALADAGGNHILGLCELVRSADGLPFADDDAPIVAAVLRAVSFAIDNYFLHELLDG